MPTVPDNYNMQITSILDRSHLFMMRQQHFHDELVLSLYLNFMFLSL